MPPARAADGWSRHIGHSWTEVLRHIELSPTATVVEIGPGFATKIGFGLAELRFRGTVILVEPGESARHWARARYQKLLPESRIRSVPQAVPDARSLLGTRVDVLVGNHVLDDMLLHAALQPAESAQLFARMRPGEACSSRFLSIWKQLFRDPLRLEALVTRVVDDFHTYVSAIRPRVVLLSQYNSWQHYSHNLEAIHDHSMTVVRALLVRIADDGALGMDVELRPHRSVVWLTAVSRSRAQLSSDSSCRRIPSTSSVAE